MANVTNMVEAEPMKKLSAISARWFTVVVTLAAAAVARPDDPPGDAKADNKLIGTWKMVSAKYDGQEFKRAEGYTTLKHVTPVHFLWVTYGKDGTVTRGAGGTYTLKDMEYVETPEYGVGADFEAVKGKAHTFKWKVEGNKWYHSGKLSDGLMVEEVWERVEKK